jgi:hypothetical protein
MSYGPDPFDAGQREALAASDALLDRIGSRAPTPEDLDDPVVASLALIAAEIDLDPVPLDVTRAAVDSERTGLPLAGPGRQDGPDGAVVDERTGLVLDLRDLARSDGELQARDSPRRLPAAPPEEDVGPRRPRRAPRRPSVPAPGAIAPPRSLPRFDSSRPGGSRPQQRRARGLNPAAAFVAVVAALALGIGVSAAVTGGRSVNPVTGLQQVVAQLTGGRTAEQAAAYQAATRKLAAAEAALKRGDTAEARADLQAIDLGNPELAPDDLPALTAKKRSLEAQLAR